MAVEIKEITSKRDLFRFVQFGNKFYNDCENFCPSLILDEMDTFNLKKNPAFDQGLKILPFKAHTYAVVRVQ